MTLTGAGTTGAICDGAMRQVRLWRTGLAILEGKTLPTKNINVGSGPPIAD